MPFSRFYKLISLAALTAVALVQAQMAPVLQMSPAPLVKAARGSVAVVTIKAALPKGYHANTHTPTENYLIPMTLKWTAGVLEVSDIAYPKGTMEKYSFSDKPINVVTGEFAITTKFKVPQETAAGPLNLNGSLRYQACDDHACYPPKTVGVSVTVKVE